MDTNQSCQVYDLLILVDATASMSNYLQSLNQSLPEIISISSLTGCFERLGVLAYRDYSCASLLEWSGWRTPLSETTDLVDFASKLQTEGNWTTREALKTGLAKAHEVMREDATTLILLYCDAAPHLTWMTTDSDGVREQQALMMPESYDGHGDLFADWVSAARTLRDGTKKAEVICLLNEYRTSGMFQFLTTVTGGACVKLQNTQPRMISELTVEILLAWMGVKKEGSEGSIYPARISNYRNPTSINEVAGEADPQAGLFFATKSDFTTVMFYEDQATTQNLEIHLPKRSAPVENFSDKYKTSSTFRELVVHSLQQIIERDVLTMSLNPVFGSLWRTVCSDRDNENRQALVDLFASQVNSIVDESRKARMKKWLEESYDYTAEVMDLIEHVPADEKFPCVCLDPTLTFVPATATAGRTDEQEITAFRRDELLEIGRSCDARILRRLGKVLTRLTFINSADEMPAHIANADDTKIQKIPLALAAKKHRRQFWRILLHVVVPGTLLGSRPAAVLAALSIRMGIEPLYIAATRELLLWRERWNDIEVPETWNLGCLSLLLDADKTYRRRKAVASVDGEGNVVEGLLLENDRLLFERLIDLKLLEYNMETTLTARLSWTPQRKTMPIGPVVQCSSCHYFRSVTIMGPGGVCGICIKNPGNSEDACTRKATRAAKDESIDTAVWYQCSMSACLGQYVVYNVEKLNVRPKCHFCRETKVAPLVECETCQSRMVWPEEYRPQTGLVGWTCIGCEAGNATVVDTETSADELRAENGDSWLLTNDGECVKHVFQKRSMFHTASTADSLENFCARVKILPGRTQEQLGLRSNGRLVQNASELLDDLARWISKRRTESATCSLCFTDGMKKSALLPACGRSGCLQRICSGCLDSWYGLNAAGRIINTAALACPFCRRFPTAKTLARYGKGVHAVANLQQVIERRGEWIYAWCKDCGHAKEYLERVCAGGAPAEVRDWQCDPCSDARATRPKTRLCPGCGVMTEKTGGCDHITCRCGVHWCFYCGDAQTSSGIYAHMSTAHGGFFDGGDGDNDVYDYDTDMEEDREPL